MLSFTTYWHAKSLLFYEIATIAYLLRRQGYLPADMSKLQSKARDRSLGLIMNITHYAIQCCLKYFTYRSPAETGKFDFNDDWIYIIFVVVGDTSKELHVFRLKH